MSAPERSASNVRGRTASRTATTRLGAVALVIASLVGAGCIADAAPTIGAAVAGDSQASVSWTAPPGDNGASLIAYVVTPFIGSVAQPPVRFSSNATTQTVAGLVNGTTYTFSVHGINALGNETARSAPSNAITPSATPIAAGHYHSCALASGGTVKCWGGNEWGQLGDGTTTINTLTPVTVVGIADATAIVAGSYHTCAVVTGGAVKCWGKNTTGQLGDGTATSSSTPVTVTGLTGVASITGGGDHTCARLTGGAVKCWGVNTAGQLGNGTTSNSAVPVTVPGITGAAAITASQLTTCALLTTSAIKCWGYNGWGALGDGTTTNSLVPVTVVGISDATAVTTASSVTCALVVNGAAKCWGTNIYGGLGDGTTTDSPIPVSVVGIGGATSISNSNGGSTCVLGTDGVMRCWGANSFGQLGDGTTTDRWTPVTVTGIGSTTSFATGSLHACAQEAGGALRCWGENHNGQLGDGTTANSSTPVTVIGL